MHIDPADIYLLADRLDRHPFIIVSALSGIKAEELAPSLERYDERVKSFKERSTAQICAVDGGVG